jgi:hypothetical protein
LCGFEAQLKILFNHLIFNGYKALKHVVLVGIYGLFSYLIYVVKQRDYERR